MKTGYKIADAMTERPIYATSAITLTECAKMMDDNHVGSLIIKDKDSLKGVITEQDIVRKAVAKGLDTDKTKVSDIMETQLLTVKPDDDIYDALVLMRDYNIRQLPVMEKNKLLGLLTLKDILKIEPQLFDLVVEKFELREASRKPINRIIPNEGICEACGEYSERVVRFKGSLFCDECKEEQE
ncbi:MAG: CBS domain-containing protein [Nanoarchaeota archaeon]